MNKQYCKTEKYGDSAPYFFIALHFKFYETCLSSKAIRCAPQEKFIVSIALAAIKAMIIVKLCDVTVLFDNFIETNEDKNVMKP